MALFVITSLALVLAASHVPSFKMLIYKHLCIHLCFSERCRQNTVNDHYSQPHSLGMFPELSSIHPCLLTSEVFFVEFIRIYEFFSTGLDPALPLFQSGDSESHLAASDAKFVGRTFLLHVANQIFIPFSFLDVIHTDGGLFGIPWVSL